MDNYKLIVIYNDGTHEMCGITGELKEAKEEADAFLTSGDVNAVYIANRIEHITA